MKKNKLTSRHFMIKLVLVSLTTKELVIESLDTRGKWDGEMTFRAGDVRVIEFDTDYINSLKLVSN